MLLRLKKNERVLHGEKKNAQCFYRVIENITPHLLPVYHEVAMLHNKCKNFSISLKYTNITFIKYFSISCVLNDLETASMV